MDFRQIIDKTLTLSEGFGAKYEERDHLIDLMEEVGELAQALQISSGRKITNDPAKQRTQEDVSDALCDVLFEVIRLADKRGVDLEAEYLKTLDHIQSRMDKGEFAAKARGV